MNRRKIVLRYVQNDVTLAEKREDGLQRIRVLSNRFTTAKQ